MPLALAFTTLFGFFLLLVVLAIAKMRPKTHDELIWAALSLLSAGFGFALTLNAWMTEGQPQPVDLKDGTYLVAHQTSDKLFLDDLDGILETVRIERLVATHKSDENYVVVKDGYATAYLSDSPVTYTSDQFTLETRPGQASPSLAHIKTERLDGSLQIDRIVTHHEDTTLLVVDENEAVLKVPQGFWIPQDHVLKGLRGPSNTP